VSCARRSPDKATKDPGSIPGTSTSRSPKAPFLKRDGAFGGIMALVGHRKPAAVMVTRTAGTAIANVVAAAFTRLTQDGWGSAAATTALTTPMSMRR
jgi:hypothetical protein